MAETYLQYIRRLKDMSILHQGRIIKRHIYLTSAWQGIIVFDRRYWQVEKTGGSPDQQYEYQTIRDNGEIFVLDPRLAETYPHIFA